MIFPKFFTIFILAGLVLSACGSLGASLNASDALAQGKAQFVSLCASCHSVDGTGSDIAPSVIGHTAEAIAKQVRNPVGGMPAFSQGLLPDSDLELLVQYVVSLGGEEAHPEIMPSEEEQIHLMAALEAIEDPQNVDREVAINHLQQAMALGTEEAAAVYAELIEAIENGKASTARHELEELLGMTD